ncbi:MAG: TonB-dependent receptor [Candidatus Brevundimonas colombiensis]|uniref:TonB-dependent receptor n=1 Tax=Candidatus Brevundimonas colombiensis TaxID=3121376 RepID=A0AAJ6BLA6_9CAUL|nr:TonB-dependent receptor [Brevundimonas sp.]WEK41313.1 MAG: TonB-dependent receptor [Brevundimonas sp.]
MTFRNLAYGASAVAILMSASTGAFAQETTGAITGFVYDASGAPLAGATVTVTHTPSGTTSTTVTDQTGQFSARGLRVGGPYTVRSVSTSGDASSQVSSIGIGTPVAVELVVAGASGSASQVADVVVTGIRSGGLRTSPRANLNLSDIETLPSIGRDIKDIVRTTPFATVDPTNQDALSIGGQNTRYNAILLDGIRQSDDFGLNGNGYPTLNSPISRSVIEAVTVDVAPYGVQYGSFTGGVVNSVTKSGTNDFHGEIFYEKTDQDLRGETFSYKDFVSGQRQDRSLTGEFEDKTWGATLRGPIIRDRLFFLLNYEKNEQTTPVLAGPAGAGLPNEAEGITQSQIDQVREIAKTVYNFDPLDWRASNLGSQDEKYFAKIDWNINDRHRAVVSYQQTEASELRLNNTTTSGTNVSVGLLSSAYKFDTSLKVYRAQLFSDWTDRFSTELSVSRKEVENISNSLAGNDFAAMQVYLDSPYGAQAGTRRSIRFGPERSRHANSLTVETTLYRAVAKYDAGFGHRFTGGFEREEQDVFNLFVQVANGEYEFDSIDSFRNRQAASIGYSNAASNNKNDGAASFKYAQNTLYFQDEWSATPNLTITAGLRYDWYTTDDKPQVNPGFVQRFGFANNATIDGISSLQPRFGFNWRAPWDVTVYGGFGRFQGGSPNVWLSNAYSNPGNLLGSFQCKTAANYQSQFARNFAVCSAEERSALANVNGLQVADVAKQAVTTSAALGTGNINLTDPTFKTPSIWKTSLGATKSFDFSRFRMGEGWRVTAEYVHSELEDAIGWVDLSLARTQNGAAPDGRPVFGPNPVRRGQQVLMLTNIDGGKADQFAFAVGKDWYDGWLNGAGFNLSYTYLDSKDASGGTSSTASSNFGNIALSDPNDAPLATSSYEIEHALKLNVSYSRAFFGDYRTRINLYAQRRSGLAYSYTFGNADFGEYITTSRQLLYVPQVDSSGNITATSDPRVSYGANFNVANFNDFLKRTGLIDYAGEISPRNAFKSPYVTTVDMHIEQELPAFFPGGAKLIGYMDIENLGNLINDEWGSIQQIGFPYTSGNVDATIANNRYTYTNFSNRSPSVPSVNAVWQIKLGVRYQF